MNENVPSPRSAINLVSQVNEASRNYLQNELAAQNLEGIVPAHGQILFPLFSSGEPLCLKDIVRITGRAKSTITGMADTLEKHGYVERLACPGDKRSVTLALTEKGKDVEKVFYKISENMMDLVYRDIGPTDQEALMRILFRIKENLTSGSDKE